MRRRNRAAAAYSESVSEERLADRGRSDGDLLACFLACDDVGAFAVLVARYARMVVAVCGGVLRHRQDAEDAYQATILVLIRKASSLNQEEPIGGWLHGVAYHEAMNVKKSKKRREYHEGQCESCSTTQTKQPIGKAAFHELQDFVDEAVQRLPVKLRRRVRLVFPGGEEQCGSRSATRLAERDRSDPEEEGADTRATRFDQSRRRPLTCGVEAVAVPRMDG